MCKNHSGDSCQGRVLTGHRTTGPRHLGHLVGTLDTWKDLQNSYQCFFLLADLHVLTTDYEHPMRIQTNIQDVLIDWLAAGIDPNRSVIVLQSSIYEHAQLEVLLSMLVTVARLSRVPTYKEQQQQLGIKPSLGLLAYPVLQAADILLYKADTVPVGEDQLPHLELTREVARRFNQLYGETFPEPRAILSSMPRLPGIDNRAMHTSYGNTIALKDTPEDTTRKVMGMYTDPARIHATDPGRVQGNPVFVYLDLFEPNEHIVEDFKHRYQAGRVGDVEVKRHLARVLNEYLAPLRQHREEWASRKADLVDILSWGSKQAQPVAQVTLKEVHQRMGLR